MPSLSNWEIKVSSNTIPELAKPELAKMILKKIITDYYKITEFCIN